MDNTSYFSNLGRPTPQQKHHWDMGTKHMGYVAPRKTAATNGSGTAASWATELLPDRPGSFAEALLGPTFRSLTARESELPTWDTQKWKVNSTSPRQTVRARDPILNALPDQVSHDADSFLTTQEYANQVVASVKPKPARMGDHEPRLGS